MHAGNIRRAIRLVALGAGVALVDVPVRHTDVFDDSVGLALLLAGLIGMARLGRDPALRHPIGVAQAVTAVALAVDLVARLRPEPLPPSAALVLSMAPLVALGALVPAVQAWCRASGRHTAARSWHDTWVAVVSLLLVPAGAVLALAIAGSLGSPVHRGALGAPAWLLMRALAVVPLLHLALSGERLASVLPGGRPLRAVPAPSGSTSEWDDGLAEVIDLRDALSRARAEQPAPAQAGDR